MNWLDLARAGENCPQATERSFSAHERAKWERAAEYTNRSGGTAPGCEPGDLPDYPGVTAGKDEHDRAREREEAEWGFPMPLADDAPIDWKIALRARDERIAALAIERGYLRRALERIAADLGLDEESFPVPTDAGEIVSFRQVIRGRIADLAQKRGEAQDGYKHFTFDPPVRIGEAKEMPPWPAPIVTSDDYYYAKEVEAWRDAACLEIKRLQAIIDAAKEALC